MREQPEVLVRPGEFQAALVFVGSSSEAAAGDALAREEAEGRVVAGGEVPVTATHITYIGKESNKLEDVEAGVVHDPDEVLTEYADSRHDPFRTLALPVLQHRPDHEIA